MRHAPPPIRGRAWIRAGLMLDFVGQAMVPLGLGALLGFYAADQGVRLLPTLLGLILGWGVAALLFIGVGRWLRGRAFESTPQGLRLRRSIVVIAVLSIIGLGARLALYQASRPTELTSQTFTEFDAAFLQDAERYRQHAQGMERLLDRLEARGVPQAGDGHVLSPEEERLLRDTWRALWDYSHDLDQVRVFYEDYYRFDPSRVQRSYHLRSFLLTYAAELALYENGARFAERVLANPNARKFLDAPQTGMAGGDLPEGSFSRFRQELLGTRDQARVVAGEQYLKVLKTGLDGRHEAQILGVSWLWDAAEDHLKRIKALGLIDRTTLTATADAQLLKRGVRRVWFPVQREVAEAMGDIRVRRIGRYLIPEEQSEQLAQMLEPGDILLARKNWYLSNVGLPGFWPHAILYVGTPEQLDAWADDPGIRDWLLEEHKGTPTTFSEHLRQIAPTAALMYVVGGDAHPYQVIEAVSEGVVFNNLAHVAGDYVAAMRPRLSKKARAQAIAYAFQQQGRPYDFDFDFATDDALVCTELVWRSYRPGLDKEGLDLPLVEVAGRMTLPANEIAHVYAAQADSELRQLDFVAFIDALESEQRTFFSDEAAYRQTWLRPQWDTAQK